MWSRVERQRRDNRYAEGGVTLPTGGEVWVPPSRNFFLNFYIKIVSFRAFWVAISYRLADCFARIVNTPAWN